MYKEPYGEYAYWCVKVNPFLFSVFPHYYNSWQQNVFRLVAFNPESD